MLVAMSRGGWFLQMLRAIAAVVHWLIVGDESIDAQY